MIPEFTKTIFLQALGEWGQYVEKFERLSQDEQKTFLKEQGFESLHNILAHVAAWWEEGEAVIHDILDKRERPRREYDFNQFNAEAIDRFKGTSDAELLDWYEVQRQHLQALVSSLSDEQIKIRRVQSWLNGVSLEHLKEHGIDAARFLTLDMLRREWGGVLASFTALSPEEQKAYLDKQGFASFRDVIAHVIAWWDDGLEVIDAISKDPGYSPHPRDTDTYNAEAVKLFGRLDEGEVWRRFESTRQSLIELTINLPEETFNHKYVQAWLRSDVIKHYFDHAR